ncbi:MAG: hypothetical protein ACO3RX_04110 [Chthoniobacterales bacterium]
MLRLFVIIAAALLFAQPELEAQNIFRPSQGGQMSAAPGVSSPINQGIDGGPIMSMGSPGGGGRYNMRVGPVQMNFNAGMGVAYNSNVNASRNDPQGDFYLTPRVGVAIYWPFSKVNNFSLDLQTGYNYYLTRTDLNRQQFYLSPGSQIAFNIFIRDVRITLYTRPSITTNPAFDPTVSDNGGNYNVASNTAGINVAWDLNDVLFNVGLANSLNYSLTNDYTNQNNTGNQIYANGSFMVQPYLRLGLQGSVSTITYFEGSSQGANSLNNGISYMLGPFATGNLTRYTMWAAGAGWQISDFNESNNPLNTGNASNPYFYFSISNELNKYFTHSFNASFETAPSYQSNFVQLFSLGYNFSWILIRDWSLGGGIFYNNGSESPGPNSQDFNQAGFNLSLGYQLTKNWFANVYYSFIGRGSTVPVDQYNQQILGVNLNYAF